MDDYTIPITKPANQFAGNVSQPKQETTYPSEVVDLPSQGHFYDSSSPLSNGTINLKVMTAKEEDILTNQNYIKKGIVGSWLGVNFVRTELLRMPVDYVREVLLFTDQAIGLGLPGEVFLRAGENPERQYQNQMYIELNFGATRVEDEKIVKIRCKSLYKTDGTK